MRVKSPRKFWGDPWSYSDVHFAGTQLVKPNKFICVCCLEQALTEELISHKTDCPAYKLINIEGVE